MTNMQRLVLVLAFIFAILVGILLATTLMSSKTGSTASPSPSGAALASPSSAPSASSSASAAPSASASASPTPSPTAKPIAAATIQFVQLALDATSDTAGTTRTVTMTAQTGTVTVKLKTESGGNTKACLFADGTQLACRTGISGTLTGTIKKKSSNMKLTLRGAGSATPVVDVAITFPATKPKVTISNARFDGTASPATNGLQVVAKPRTAGTYRITADWGGHPFLYEIDLIEQGGPGLKTIKSTTGATKVNQGFAVTATNSWMIVLKNSETGFGATALNATFTWP